MAGSHIVKMSRLSRLSCPRQYMFNLIIGVTIVQLWLYSQHGSTRMNEQPPRNTTQIRSELRQLDAIIKPISLFKGNQKVHYFRAYIYSTQEMVAIYSSLNMAIKTETLVSLSRLDHITKDPQTADMFIVILPRLKSGDHIVDLLAKLPYWNGGRSHVIVVLTTEHGHSDFSLGRLKNTAMIASPTFHRASFREKFDVVIPILSNQVHEKSQLKGFPPMMTARRKFLVSFLGELDVSRTAPPGDAFMAWTELCSGDEKDADVDMSCTCPGSTKSELTSDWKLCLSPEERYRKLTNATFTLIPTPATFLSTSIFQTRFYEALKASSIPVVLGERAALPFDEILNWGNVAVFLNSYNYKQIRDFLMTFSDRDIFEMRRAGRILWSNYLQGNTFILDTVLLVIRMRTSQLISLPARETATRYNGSMHIVTSHPTSQRQVSNVIIRHQRLDLQLPVDPFHHYSSTPFQSQWSPTLFVKDHISKTLSNQSASVRNVQGNLPVRAFHTEKLTVVMIMFNRLQTLSKHVQRFKDASFVERILIVWDSPLPLTKEYTQLDSNGKLKFIRVGRDSLNNRFLPFDLIQTEGVLIMDDDMMPSVTSLLAGFMLWQQNRDQIVGQTPRTVTWNLTSQSWSYGDASRNEYSIVLTHIMFIHKFYLVLYTNHMPPAIRAKVDELVNCEDIAMNFLVAHVTRKPPMKTNLMHEIISAGNNTALSKRKSHRTNRSRCVQYFTEIYGYLPLAFSQSTTSWDGGEQDNDFKRLRYARRKGLSHLFR